jgi:hypothetical protein
MGEKLSVANPYLRDPEVRERTVLRSVTTSSAIEGRNRRVVAAGELSQRQIDAIHDDRVPDQYADLDKEIKD